jgi:hypothetical protein
MASKVLEYAERRMQQKWYDLVTAEQQGATVQVLERLYTAYMLAVEQYNRCVAEDQRDTQAQPISVPVQQKKAS